jgi:cystathionine gamma-synthase
VSRVFYPGLSDHPQHELAKHQQAGFGGMLSFELAGGEPALVELLGALKLFSLAVSLGSVESLVCHPASMSHVPLGEAGRRAAGIGDNLVRLSLGIEAKDDLIADLSQALDRASANGVPTAQGAG